MKSGQKDEIGYRNGFSPELLPIETSAVLLQLLLNNSVSATKEKLPNSFINQRWKIIIVNFWENKQ